MKSAEIAASLITGLIFSAAILYISWQHNPQCEFHCEGQIYWENWLPYGVAAFLIGSVLAIVLFAIFQWCKKATSNNA